jgi:hypothetical protein
MKIIFVTLTYCNGVFMVEQLYLIVELVFYKNGRE